MLGRREGLGKLCGLAVGLVVVILLTGTARAGVLSAWDGTGSNDSTVWSGLGADGTTIPTSFTATSAQSNAISGSFAGSSGLVAIQCPAAPSCSWTGGFTAGDSLIWAFDNANNIGTGPLTLSLGTAVLAGGVEIQSDAAVGAFTAQVEAFHGAALLGTESLTSDAAGDPVFIGAQDTVAEITSLIFDLTSCTGPGCDVNDFVVDTLISKNPTVTAVPEPGTLALLATSLLGLGALRRRRRT